MDFLGIHGVFLVILLAYLIRINSRVLRSGLNHVVDFVFRIPGSHPSQHTRGIKNLSWETAAIFFVASIMIYMAVTGYWVVLLMTAFIGLTALVVRE